MRDVIERLPQPPDISMRTGVVVSFDAGVLVVLIGEEPIEADRIKSYAPTAGDVVLVLIGHGTITALGAIV